MNTVYAILLSIGITAGVMSCSLAPTYDGTETWKFTEFATHAKFLHQQDCEKGPPSVKDRVEKMHWTIQMLDIYAETAPNHEEIKRITKILLDDVKEFNESYKDDNDKVYCRFKAEAIIIKSHRMIAALNGLQR